MQKASLTGCHRRMNTPPGHTMARDKQTGATLIVGLVMLLLIAIVGMSSMEVTTLDVKVVSNAKDRQLAFNAADSMLLAGGRVIEGANRKLDNTHDGYMGTVAADWWSNDDNWTNTTDVAAAESSDYIIEEFDEWYKDGGGQQGNDGIGDSIQNNSIGPKPSFFRYPVKAKAVGPGGSEVVLASKFIKRLESNTVN